MLELELSLHPDDLPRLAKMSELTGGPAAATARRPRPVPLRLIWHDTPERTLEEAGLSLVERQLGRATSWRVERTGPPPEATDLARPDIGFWAPCVPPLLVAEAASPAGLAGVAPERVVPLAVFKGVQRVFQGCDRAAVRLVAGEVHGVASTRRLCRLTLSGDAAEVTALALALVETVRLSVPDAPLAAEAQAGSRSSLPAIRPRRAGAPSLPPGLRLDHAVPYLTAHLLDVILVQGARAMAGEAPEPVHQMRVAVRRLRSAFALFRPFAASPELQQAKADLKLLALALGPARDWDVFTAGTCAEVAAALPDDPAVRRLTLRAQRRRDEGYAALHAYLQSAAFRRLGLRLALLFVARPACVDGNDAGSLAVTRDPAAMPQGPTVAGTTVAEPEPAPSGPPEVSGPSPSLAAGRIDLADYAARTLSKRLKRMLAPGEDITSLPAAELHAIRLNGKRLRYAAEFFAPLFPRRQTRRFLRRISSLQERLGQLNDGAVAANLLAEIGLARVYAGGVVRGLVAADGLDARRRIGRSWKRLRKLDPFWD